MKRFKWRLDRVLEIKQKEEQVQRAELVAITEKLSQARGKLFMQKRILKELIDSVSEERPENRLARQQFVLQYTATNDSLIRELEHEVETLAEQQQQKMADILELKQFNEGLHKLREEARTEFLSEQEKTEQKALDESTTFRFAQKVMTQSEEAKL